MSAEDIKETIGEAEEKASDAVETVAETVADKAEEVVEEVKDAAADKAEEVVGEVKDAAADKTDEVVEEVKDTVAEKTDEAKERVSEKREEIREKASEKKEEVREKVSEKKEEIKEKAEEVKEEIKDGGKSNSQRKREQRRKEVASARRKARTATALWWCLGAVVAALVIWGITALVIKQLNRVAPIEDYSAGLDANGYITGVTAADKVELPDYKNIKIPYSEIEYTDESIDSDIETELKNHEEISTDASLSVEDGDKVNISFVGTVDGTEFEGGSSDSYDLTIGSGSFIDDFEDQLIGSSVGDEVEVNVTFPDDYSNADVAGKDAVFMVNILGIYDAPELTDDFVAETISADIEDADVSTVQEYRDYIRSTHEEDNVKDYVKDYLIDNTTVKSYPGKYVKTLKGIKRYDDEQSYEYMNQMYQSYYGYSVYESFEDYVGMTMDEYFKDLTDQSKDTAKENMIYQAIVEKENAVADAAYYKAYLTGEGNDETYYDTQVETSGEPFVLQQAIQQKALEIAVAGASVEK